MLILTKFSSFEDLFAECTVFAELKHSISWIIGEFFQSSRFFVSELLHFEFEFVIVLGNIFLFFLKRSISRIELLAMLENLEFHEIDSRFLRTYRSQVAIDFLSSILIMCMIELVILHLIWSITLEFRVHLLEFRVVFRLLRFKNNLHHIRFFQVLILRFFFELREFILSLFHFLLLFFFHSFNHIFQFF